MANTITVSMKPSTIAKAKERAKKLKKKRLRYSTSAYFEELVLRDIEEGTLDREVGE